MRPFLIPAIFLVAACSGGDKGDEEYPPVPPITSNTTTTTDTNTEPLDCDQAPFEVNGVEVATYDCSTLDRCNETDIAFFTACCSCDPQYCNPDPNCEDPDPTTTAPVAAADSCMSCHNGSDKNDYYGTGLSNPHPFPGAANIKCTTCHGGNGAGGGKTDSHVPTPPQIGDDLQLQNDAESYFNFLTLTGVDKWEDYTVNGVTYSPLDWLQFRNPGDLRVVQDGRSCGTAGCHAGEHVDWFSRSVIATEVGFYSVPLYTSGVSNAVPEHRGWFGDTAGDYAFRYVSDPNFVYDESNVGIVGKLLEYPEDAVYGDPLGVYQNAIYDANTLPNFVYQDYEENGQKTNRIKDGSPLATLVTEIVAQVCGDCHAGSAGANNRYADFRSSGCTSCHMQYSPDGRSRSTDPNVNKAEPANPDAIAAPERPHIDSHQIRNVAKILPNGAFVRGINDFACVGCHQGSNRTVLQYWGIRLDQNQDVTNNFQYPANPVTFTDTAQDRRLYDPAVANNTFNGRVPQQYLLFEDYDGDARDDTPPDIHYELGMGCIDCHGSRDLHGGTAGDPSSGGIVSRQDQMVKVECESCHGDENGYAYTVPCEDYSGAQATCAADRNGNALRNVTVDVNGDYWLISRVDGQRHYTVQTQDVIVDNQKSNPISGKSLYSPIGSYAMGRVDGSANTGVGPQQGDPLIVSQNFSHMDGLDCTSCHSSWQNNCIGCHLDGIYDDNPQNYFFSNTTGERITLNFAANFTYQNPILFTMMVGTRNLITEGQSGMKMFYKYTDLNGNTSDVLTFSDRNGNGNNPNVSGRGAFGALAHNRIRAHSTRGRVDTYNEGGRYCVACHLNTEQLDNFGADYAVFMDNLLNRDYAAYTDNGFFDVLQAEIGQNPGNQNNSPYFVHMAAGLGTGLFLFDANGCPVNPLDANANRFFCNGNAPADIFDINTVAYDLDRIVEPTGIQNSSTSHPMLEASFTSLRGGSLQPNIAGPLGANLINKLADPNYGVVLDGWIDADGVPQGTANNFVQ